MLLAPDNDDDDDDDVFSDAEPGSVIRKGDIEQDGSIELLDLSGGHDDPNDFTTLPDAKAPIKSAVI